MVLTSELEMTISDKADYIKIEPELVCISDTFEAAHIS